MCHGHIISAVEERPWGPGNEKQPKRKQLWPGPIGTVDRLPVCAEFMGSIPKFSLGKETLSWSKQHSRDLWALAPHGNGDSDQQRQKH